MLDLNGVLAVLFIYLGIYFPQELDPSLKPKDSSALLTSSNQELIYDFIIVGAGSAGSVVTNRLSANESWKVVLIEAGGDESYYTDTPGLARTLANTKYEWNYTTTAQPRACLNNGGICSCARGHVMGGTSVVNGMLYVRGNEHNYNEWERLGNPGWNYDSILKYFLKSENMTVPELLADGYHSNEGLLTVGYSKFINPLNKNFLNAGKEFGLKEIDINGRNQIGIGHMQYTVRDSTRCSASKAFLDPIRHRTNLSIFKNTRVIKVLVNNGRATGVTVVLNGKHYNISASKEVILSAGSQNTPQLLMLSGIGPKEILQKFSIPVLKDLPVGKYLADQPQQLMYFDFNDSSIDCCRTVTNETIVEYSRDRTGPLSGTERQIQIYLHADVPNKPIVGMGFGFNTLVNASQFGGLKLAVVVSLFSPRSKGEVTISSANYQDPPISNPNYFADLIDMKALKWAMRQTLKIMNTNAMKEYAPKLNVSDTPHCLQYYNADSVTDQFLDCYIKYQGQTGNYHLVSTARMGPNPQDSVVDPQLRVHGVAGLRVIDASIMPFLVTANVNAPTYMIAEKGAEMVIESYQ